MANYYIVKHLTGNTAVDITSVHGVSTILHLPVSEAEKLLHEWAKGTPRYFVNTGAQSVTGVDLTQIQTIVATGVQVKYKSTRTDDEKKAMSEFITKGNAYLNKVHTDESREEVVQAKEESAPPNAEEESTVTTEEVVDTTAQEYAVFQVECRCGSNYSARMYHDTLRAKCRECKERVYVDFQRELVQTATGSEAQVMTNKYYVAQQSY